MTYVISGEENIHPAHAWLHHVTPNSWNQRFVAV
jgi:hypothetical protein